MASEEIESLFYIAQKNSNEILEEQEFEEDIRNSIFAELKGTKNNINDEYKRTLSIILIQAENNPNILGEPENGKYKVSKKCVEKAVSTVKYANSFIEGTEEYAKRVSSGKINLDSENIILTVALIDNMISSYDKL